MLPNRTTGSFKACMKTEMSRRQKGDLDVVIFFHSSPPIQRAIHPTLAPPLRRRGSTANPWVCSRHATVVARQLADAEVDREVLDKNLGHFSFFKKNLRYKVANPSCIYTRPHRPKNRDKRVLFHWRECLRLARL